MRTVNYSEILAGSAALAGMGPGDVGEGELELFRQYHDGRLQEGWEVHGWPELCPTEERFFRDHWGSGTAYGAGDEVYDAASLNYFQSLQAGNTGHAPTVAGVENSAWWAASAPAYTAADWASGVAYGVGSQVRNPGDGLFYQCISGHTSGASFDGTKFGVLTPFVRYVGWEQRGPSGQALTAIGEFLHVWRDHPWRTTRTVELRFEVRGPGAVLVEVQRAVGSVWVEYRIRRPVLTGSVWDSARVYTSGLQVYFVNPAGSASAGVGNFYTASATTAAGESPLSAPGKWAVVEIPYFLRSYLIRGGYADWLAGDGQEEKAERQELRAVGVLEQEADKLERQGGQVRRLSWKR